MSEEETPKLTVTISIDDTPLQRTMLLRSLQLAAAHARQAQDNSPLTSQDPDTNRYLFAHVAQAIGSAIRQLTEENPHMNAEPAPVIPKVS